MQLVSKLFLAFWALIAVAQFASGATTYSELKPPDVAKITVGVTGGVAYSEGCTPKVHFYSLGEILIHFFARAEEGETLPTTTARSVGRKEQRDAFSRARFFRRKKVLCFAMGCCSRAFLFN